MPRKRRGGADEFADLGGSERLEAEHRTLAREFYVKMVAHLFGMYRRMDEEMPGDVEDALDLIADTLDLGH